MVRLCGGCFPLARGAQFLAVEAEGELALLRDGRRHQAGGHAAGAIPGDGGFCRAHKKAAFIFMNAAKKLAATYSRASYTGTTIGNAVFDGRVRNGNGSDHRFIATKKR